MKTTPRDFALLYLNGDRLEISGDDSMMMLSDWLRKRRELTGTKIVCAEGDCGACTVLRAFPNLGATKAARFIAINSCITTVAQMDCSHIVTIEGITKNNEPSPVQEAMLRCHGSQCGFCTPGFVMAITSLVEEHGGPLDVKRGINALTGNLCRCTGYLPICTAIMSMKIDPKFSVAARYLTSKSLRDLRQTQMRPMEIRGESDSFLAPVSERDVVRVLAESIRKKAPLKLVAGGTDLGVQRNKGKLAPTNFVSLHLIADVYQIQKTAGRVAFGARVTLEEGRKFFQKSFPEFCGLLNIFASPQIKNLGTFVGNVATGSPIGDTLPLLLVSEAIVHTASWHKGRLARRAIPLEKFYLGYRKTALKSNELVTHLSMALPKRNQKVRFYKVSQRKDLDISALSAAFCIEEIKAKGLGRVTIKSARVALGGVDAVARRIPQVERTLIGAEKSTPTLERAILAIGASINPISDARSSSAYRHVVAENLMKRFWEEVSV